jgi:hypothetical protein
MPTLTDAEASLAAAHDVREQTRIASQEATANAAALRAKLKAGGRGSAKITAADIAAADQAAEFAALAHEGAKAEIPALAAAVKDARADQACDEVLAELPQLGQDVLFALQAVEAVLSPLVAAVERYDTFVESAVQRLEKVAPTVEPTHVAGAGLNPRRRGGTADSPFVGRAETPSAESQHVAARPSRFNFPRHSQPTVDGVPLGSCRGAAQLARVLLPFMADLGTPGGTLEGLKLLAAGAPQLPTP